MSKLIVGCGYVGKRLARHWRDSGQRVHVTTRDPVRAQAFENEGLHPIVFDVTNPRQTQLPPSSTVAFAVGYDRTAGYDIHDAYVDGLQHVLDRCDPDTDKVIYVSSTGVYGEADGSFVDENTPCQPTRAGGIACLNAERLLQRHPVFGSKSIILRLAGIYGPNRLPQLAKLQSGEPLAVADDAHLNLIHVDDIVRIIAACDEKLTPPAVFCVSDGHPIQRGDFYRCLARLLGCPDPVFEPPAAGTPRAERLRGDKKIVNQKLVQRLQPQFLFPSYREGLRSIVSKTEFQ